jgi:hypothetical protein
VFAREKKRATWSLVAGATLALSYLAWSYWTSFQADDKVRALVRLCEQERPAKLRGFNSYKAVEKTFAASPQFQSLNQEARAAALNKLHQMYCCEPAEIDEDSDPLGIDRDSDSSHIAKMTDRQNDIWQVYEFGANQDRFDGWFVALVVFLISCLPLVWYLFLDRIRELSGAVSGKDRPD